MMEIQQYPHQTRGPLEGHLHPTTWAVQTQYYILQNVQLPGHIPGLHGWSLWRLYHKGLVGNIYEQPADPLLGLGNPWWTYSKGSLTLLRTRNVPQVGEVYLFSWRSGVSQDDSRQERSIDGSDQTQGHSRIVPPWNYQVTISTFLQWT